MVNACPTSRAVAAATGFAVGGLVRIGLALLVLVDRAMRGEQLLEDRR